MNRAEILDKAKDCVTRDRAATHGDAERSFELIADFWSCYLNTAIHAHDVAAMMGLLKIARIRLNPAHNDNWIELAGYSACGGEITSNEAQKQ